MSDKQRNERMGLDCGEIQEWRRMPRVGVSAKQQGGSGGGGGGGAGWMSGSTLSLKRV